MPLSKIKTGLAFCKYLDSSKELNSGTEMLYIFMVRTCWTTHGQ